MYPRLLQMGVLVLVVTAALRWLSGGSLPTRSGLSEGLERWPLATAAVALIGLWGLCRALRQIDRRGR